MIDETGFPMLAEAATVGADDACITGETAAQQGQTVGAAAADLDGRALAAAYEIALMWGQDRSQFVSRIQFEVRRAMDWAIDRQEKLLT